MGVYPQSVYGIHFPCGAAAQWNRLKKGFVCEYCTVEDVLNMEEYETTLYTPQSHAFQTSFIVMLQNGTFASTVLTIFGIEPRLSH